MAAPTRPQFPRTSVAGQVIASLWPGSLAINYPDKKLYVGDAGGNATILSHYLTDWAPEKAYEPGDFAVFNGDIYRAKEAVPANIGNDFDPSMWTAVTSAASLLFGEPTLTGLISGGELTLGSGTTIAIAAGSGVVVDNSSPDAVTFTRVDWGAFTYTVPMTGSRQLLVVSISAGGVLSVGPVTAVTPSFRRANLLIGFVETDDAAITSVIDTPHPIASTAFNVQDHYQALGGAFLASGVVLSAPAATLALATSAGTLFSAGTKFRTQATDPNTVSLLARNPLPFTTVDRDGETTTPDNLVHAAFWDNGSGPTAVTAGKFTVQYVFQAPGGPVYVQLGQAQYDTMTDALLNLGWDYRALEKVPGADLVVLGAVIVSETATALNDTAQARVVPAVAGRAFPFPLQFLSANEDLSGFYLLDGSRALTGDMDFDGNAIIDAVWDEGTF